MGVFAPLFQYGNVTVTTASVNLNIVFRHVPRPNEIREALLQLADEDRKFHLHNAQEG